MMGSRHSTASAGAAQKLVEDALREHPVVVFSKSYCPYCVKGKNALKEAGRAVPAYPGAQVFELDRMGAEGAAVQAYLAKKTGRRSVPNVFVAGKTIGGGDETAAFQSRGQLAGMLSAAVAAHTAKPGAAAASSSSGDAVAKTVEEAIAKNAVVIFSKSYCPFCKKAKAAVKDVGAGVPGFAGAKVFEMDLMGDGAAMQKYVAGKTGRKTVPVVFVGQVVVGGGDETVALAESGELATLIAAAMKPRSPAETVEAAIAAHPVVIFSKDYCPFCRKAKAAVATAGAKVAGFEGAKVFEMNVIDDGPAMHTYLIEKTGRRTVPNVFIGGKPVGGGDDVEGYLQSGVLPQMITAAVRGPAPTAASAPGAATDTAGTDTVLFGAGCFWGVELAFQREPGVVRTEVGYANGRPGSVTYEQVCSGTTGHAEVVKVWFNPAEVSLDRLLQLWEDRHDITSKNKQGNDRGTQYRSALYFTTDAQKDAAEKWLAGAKSRYTGKPIHTDMGAVVNYTPAEGYHQQYLEKGGQNAAKGAKDKIFCYGIPK